MSKKVHLTLACGDYESIRALKEGSIKPDGIELTVLTDMTSDIRHWRMVRNREFDVAELSMSNYLIAKYVGLPFCAIPVFLHRRFRHSFIYLNTGKAITKPTDLIGKKVGLRNFQATANLWIRGILEHEYKVPHKQMYWFKQDDEEVEWSPPADLHLERIASGKHVEQMLVDGELDALIHPELIKPILDKDRRVTRMFPNYRDLEMDYFKRTGIFPIMHTTAIKQEVIDKHPWVAINLMQAFEESKNAAYKRLENPRIVPLAWFRHFLEEQEDVLGKDPWVYGLGETNRKTLETLMQYSQEQGMLGRKMTLEELFINTTAHS
ncbi:MAG TPA: ABC transporter substrate-binding protein [Candidatus Binatia bacterium]